MLAPAFDGPTARPGFGAIKLGKRVVAVLNGERFILAAACAAIDRAVFARQGNVPMQPAGGRVLPKIVVGFSPSFGRSVHNIRTLPNKTPNIWQFRTKLEERRRFELLGHFCPAVFKTPFSLWEQSITVSDFQAF